MVWNKSFLRITFFLIFIALQVRVSYQNKVRSPPRLTKQPPAGEILYQLDSSYEEDRPIILECEADAESAPKNTEKILSYRVVWIDQNYSDNIVAVEVRYRGSSADRITSVDCIHVIHSDGIHEYTMSLRFCANLNFLFCESGASVLEKFRLAKVAGFRGVEIACPESFSTDEVVAAQKEHGLEVALINICLGSKPEAAFGCTALPNLENEFQANFRRTVEYAKALNCKKIHIMAGKPTPLNAPENDETYLRNLKFAAEQLESTGIIGVIEPINKYSLPGYYLNSYEKALNILEKLNNSNIKIMIDLFHLQLIKGNITNTLNDLKSHIGHVQVPHRNEPSTADEVNFKYVFKVLENVGYNDWVGCEYKPTNNSKDNLQWIKEYGYSF